ncbi:Na+-driven multidrug efflux pump [Granulicella aggregans]|uniref:Na+-driven multidrug efflux pump n=1 Tax=Granulicella aggregans TaxID=474949 RepID=A0A7W7ZCC7_9BACT|nr:hypothetical protein [Granulicella aggregans]MBB5057291.1 Na+-driven multidrug efflux pump [Granulicella aggregans]
MGAAIATVVSYAISGMFANALSARTRPTFLMQMKSFIPYRFNGEPSQISPDKQMRSSIA